MRKIAIDETRILLEDEIEAVYEGEVKQIGNGGMILSNKKYIGRKVYVLIKKWNNYATQHSDPKIYNNDIVF